MQVVTSILAITAAILVMVVAALKDREPKRPVNDEWFIDEITCEFQEYAI